MNKMLGKINEKNKYFKHGKLTQIKICLKPIVYPDIVLYCTHILKPVLKLLKKQTDSIYNVIFNKIVMLITIQSLVVCRKD